MQTFIVSEVLSSKPANYGKTNYRVKFEGSDDVIGLFSKFPVQVGSELNGSIEQNGQWKNFKFGQASATPAPTPQEPVRQVSNAEIKNYLDLKMMPALREIYKILATIEGRQELQMGLNERAIDRAMGHDVPPDEPVESPF